MIPNHVPYRAAYKSTITGNDGKERALWDYKPVFAWDDNGDALVADDKTGTLVPARTYSNFAGIGRAEPPIVAVIPGGGWTVTWNPDDKDEHTWPVLAWLVDADGDVKPVDVDQTGYPGEIESVSGERRFNPPTVPPTSAQTT